MEFPNRTDTHTVESKSLKILSSILPQEWIIREITERDYGIDLYIEIVGKDRKVTGKMVALQMKGTRSLKFNNEGLYTYSGIKKSTINYWLGLPAPVFFIVVDLIKNEAYWASVGENQRKGKFLNSGQTASINLFRSANFSKTGLLAFQLVYLRERNWVNVETAIEKSLMAYNTLGPLVLMCRREKDNDFCSSTIQYMLIQHYEYFTILARYLLSKNPKPLPEWYEKHIEYFKKEDAEGSFTFAFKIIKEMIDYFIFDYRECINTCYELVMESQKKYFKNRFPYLSMHLSDRPHIFITADWAPRYYFDEYENETRYPEKLFFQDFDELDPPSKNWRSS